MLGDDDDVDWCDGRDIPECKDMLILIDNVGWNFLAN